MDQYAARSGPYWTDASCSVFSRGGLYCDHRRPRAEVRVRRALARATVRGAGTPEFLQDPSLSGDVTAKEVEFLKRLSFENRRPTSLYYYRAPQNLRDPLHFRSGRAGRN
jgi:hypothetical protein